MSACPHGRHTPIQLPSADDTFFLPYGLATCKTSQRRATNNYDRMIVRLREAGVTPRDVKAAAHGAIREASKPTCSGFGSCFALFRLSLVARVRHEPTELSHRNVMHTK